VGASDVVDLRDMGDESCVLTGGKGREAVGTYHGVRGGGGRRTEGVGTLRVLEKARKHHCRKKKVRKPACFSLGADFTVLAIQEWRGADGVQVRVLKTSRSSQS